jgi:hypothetical protein
VSADSKPIEVLVERSHGDPILFRGRCEQGIREANVGALQALECAEYHGPVPNPYAMLSEKQAQLNGRAGSVHFVE